MLDHSQENQMDAKILGEWMCESEWVDELSGWVSVWVSECEWMWVSVWVSECVSVWASEWVSGWVSGCVCECVGEWMSKRVSEWGMYLFSQRPYLGKFSYRCLMKHVGPLIVSQSLRWPRGRLCLYINSLSTISPLTTASCHGYYNTSVVSCIFCSMFIYWLVYYV